MGRFVIAGRTMGRSRRRRRAVYRSHLWGIGRGNMRLSSEPGAEHAGGEGEEGPSSSWTRGRGDVGVEGARMAATGTTGATSEVETRLGWGRSGRGLGRSFRREEGRGRNCRRCGRRFRREDGRGERLRRYFVGWMLWEEARSQPLVQGSDRRNHPVTWPHEGTDWYTEIRIYGRLYMF